jgi:Arc/MetJ-type ribon-helix-helix transcriptional regulator
MSYQFPPDIEALIQQQMVSGNYGSTDHLLRAALEQLAAQDEEVRAIQQSIDLLDAGDEGISLDEAIAKLRTKHNISANA